MLSRQLIENKMYTSSVVLFFSFIIFLPIQADLLNDKAGVPIGEVQQRAEYNNPVENITWAEEKESVVAVPNLFGVALGQAETVLTGAGLIIGALSEEYSDTVLSGHVLCQYPDAGAEVPYGSKVDVILSSNQRPISDLVNDLSSMTGGQKLQHALQEVILRKGEALPFVMVKLREGAWFEKHIMTKLLRCSPWPEVSSELVRIASSEEEHWLVREGALYALAELGDVAAGPAIHVILTAAGTPAGVRRVAVAALARIGYTGALDNLRSLAKGVDIRMRLFANRALVELGMAGDTAFLLAALDDEDAIVREEAGAALALAPGENIAGELAAVADNDANAAVRGAAREALLRRQARAQKSEGGRLLVFQKALDTADRHTAAWIIRTTLNECGEEGCAYVRELALRDDYVGERARTFLVWSGKSSQPSQPAPDTLPEDAFTADDKHGPYTHTTFADYAMAKAKADGLPMEGDLADPLEQRGLAWQRLHEGAEQEDQIFATVSGEVIRQREHAYNPMTNKGFNVLGIQFGTARDRALSIWNDSLVNAFAMGDLYTEEIGSSGQLGGGWQLLGRVSHLLEDLTAPLHGLAIQHVYPGCKFEDTWKTSGLVLNGILDAALGEQQDILYSDSALPAEALIGLDEFSRTRLEYWLNSAAENAGGPIGCPYRTGDDVRGYLEVLSWISYFRTTVWGEVWFNKDEASSDSQGNATSAGILEEAVFADVTVPAGTPNALHAMFEGKVKWRDAWNDNYFTLECANGNVLYWMKVFNTDEWGACDWSDNRCEGSKVYGGDHDDQDARTVGRFWFDTREIGPGQAVFQRYPDGSTLGKDMYNYYADVLFPLTVRYNAGLINLANRRLTVKAASGMATGFQWSRADNFGNGPLFEASPDGSDFYFVAKSEVTLTAPSSDTAGLLFREWKKNGVSIASNKGVIVINTADSPIPSGGDTYSAVFGEASEGEGEFFEGEPAEGEDEGEGALLEGEPVEGEDEGEGELLEGEPAEGEVEGEPVEGEVEGEGELLEGEPAEGEEEGEGELLEGEPAEGEEEGEGELLEGEPAEGEYEGEGEVRFHPADLDADFHIVLSEAVAYLAGWQQGSNSIGYAVRAAYLWQNGEFYSYDPSEAPPLCWKLSDAAEDGLFSGQTMK